LQGFFNFPLPLGRQHLTPLDRLNILQSDNLRANCNEGRQHERCRERAPTDLVGYGSTRRSLVRRRVAGTSGNWCQTKTDATIAAAITANTAYFSA
jgi:hypothetical protein